MIPICVRSAEEGARWIIQGVPFVCEVAFLSIPVTSMSQLNFRVLPLCPETSLSCYMMFGCAFD